MPSICACRMDAELCSADAATAGLQAGRAKRSRQRELADARKARGLSHRSRCRLVVPAGHRSLPRTGWWDDRPERVGRALSAGLHVVGQRPAGSGRIRSARPRACTGRAGDGRAVRHRGRRGAGRSPGPSPTGVRPGGPQVDSDGSYTAPPYRTATSRVSCSTSGGATTSWGPPRCSSSCREVHGSSADGNCRGTR